VLLIMIDTLRADQLSCYGGPVETPNLCRLVDDGGTAYFTFSQASWTKPAAASLLTSLLPSSHRAMSKTASISPDAVLVSEAMQRAGYTTGGIVSNINLAPSFGFDQGWDEYLYLAPDYLAGAQESSSKLILYQIARKVWLSLRPGKRVGDYYQDAETVNAHVFPWLERHVASRFFLFAHFMDPHDPYFRHPYDGYAIARVAGDPPASRAPEMLALYQGEIRFLDQNLGVLFEKLRALGLYDDMLIVATADHGEEFQEHGGFWHGLTLYDETIHIPLLIKWPKGRAAGPARLMDRIARQIDIAPTILGRAGAPIPPSMQGVDLVATAHARPSADDLHVAEEDHEGNVLRALRTLQWKYLEANEGNPRGLPPRELFEVSVDPHETKDLGPARPEIAAEMRGQLDAKQQYAREHGLTGGGTAVLTDAQREALKALGYLQ
jgi:arylsulfatase A-like enzyme